MNKPMSNYEDHMIYRKGDYVEICIAPPDHEQFFCKSLYGRKMEFINFFKKIIKNVVQTCSDYMVVLEMSKNGRLHYHGVLQVGEEPLELASMIAYHRYGKKGNKRLFNIYDVPSSSLEERVKYIMKDYDVNQICYYPENTKFTKFDFVKKIKNLISQNLNKTNKINILDFINHQIRQEEERKIAVDE